MFPALIARHLERAVQSTPTPLRWLEQCDSEVIEAYRSARRSMFTKQLPALLLLAAVVFLIKAFHWLPPGHPVMVALLLIGLAVLLWPLQMARLAAVAWRTATVEARFSTRLRLLASVLYASVVVSSLGLMALTAFFAIGFSM